MSEDVIEKFKKEFEEEFSKITDIERLKDIYSLELAKRDKLISELQKENEILLKTAFKNKNSV